MYKRNLVTIYIFLVLMTLTFLGTYEIVIAQITNNSIAENDLMPPPITQSNLPISSSANATSINNEINKWINVSGHWELDERGLHGGIDSNGKSMPLNILLYHPNKEFIQGIQTSFRTHDLDMNIPNYAAIVYSFIDPENYKYAGINIFRDNIYGIFYNVSDGEVSSYPTWPGVKTDLTWKPGELYNISLINHGSVIELVINGTTFYSYPASPDDLSLGMVGLDYGRIKSIDFLDFAIESPNNSLSSIEPATNYVGNSYPVRDSVTILLDDVSIPENDYLHVYDSTPYEILDGHIVTNIPCDEDNSTDVTILVGQIPELHPLGVESMPTHIPDGMCMYQGNLISSFSDPITDVVIQNNSTEEIEFPPTSSMIVSISEISSVDRQ